MGYYIRVLGIDASPIPLAELQSACVPAILEQQNDGPEWNDLLLRHANGEEIALIERNPTSGDGLGAQELEELFEEVEDLQPESAAKWLMNYLPRIKVIYAFQLLRGTDTKDGWARLHQVHAHCWNAAGGLLQSDGEGFSNELGYTIVWQFSDGVQGKWNVATLNDAGEWIPYRMDLGDKKQRSDFLQGTVPAGVTLL